LSKLSDILRTDEREQRFGRTKYGPQWDASELTHDELNHIELICHSQDVPIGEIEQGIWRPIDSPIGARWNLEAARLARTGRNFPMYSGGPGYLQAAGEAWQRFHVRRPLLEDIRELLRLLKRYGEKPDPLENLHPSDERKKLDEARALCARVRSRTGAQAESNDLQGLAESSAASGSSSVNRGRKLPPRHDARTRGPKQSKREGVKNAMLTDLCTGRLTKAELERMLEKVMEKKYGASRDTCRKARDDALSEFTLDK
jgi:hypothetical protein